MSIIPFLFTNCPDNYLFPVHNPGEDEKALVYHLPLEVDTEYWQPSLTRIIEDSSYHRSFYNKTISIQYRGILHSEGIIFAHPDIEEVARHPITREGLTFVDYLKAIGMDATCSRSKASVNHDRTLHVHLYSFFAIAELFRIFQGEFLDDIKGMVLSSGRCSISQSRRLVAETRGSYYDPSILMSKWTVTIQNIPLTLELLSMTHVPSKA